MARDKKFKTRLLIGVAAAVLFVAGAAGSWLYVRQQNDPSHRAAQLAAQGSLRAAQVELRNALRTAPRDMDLHLRLADLAMKLADPVGAEREFKLALSLEADRWTVTPLLDDALLAQGLFEETLRRTAAVAPTPALTAQNLYRRAVAQLGMNDQVAAAATLQQARKVAPDAVETPLIAARVAAAKNDAAAVEGYADDVLKRDPAQIDALLMKQGLLAERGDHPAALTYAGRAVASAPWSAMARIRDSTEQMYAGDDAGAKTNVDAVLAVQPRFIEAVYLNGILLARQGRYEDAAGELQKLDQVLGRFPQALYYKALVAAKLGQTETAVAFARRYNVLVPNDPDGIRLVAHADIAAGASDQAVPVLQKAVDGGLKDAEIYDLLGSALGNLGETPRAIVAFRAALALKPNDAEILTHLGLAQIQAGEAAEAYGTLSRTAEIGAAPLSASEALVSAAIAAGDLAKADAALAALRQKAGDSAQVGVLTGLIAVRRQNLEAARAAFADTLKRFPASLQAKLDYARILVVQGRRLDGMALMAEVLEREPANVPALNSYVPLLMQNRQFDRVVAVLTAAHGAAPQQAGFTATLADAMVLRGEAAQAVTMVQAVRQGGPLPPLLVGALARAQAAAGQFDDAKGSFRDVLRLQPDDLADRVAFVDVLLRAKDYDTARVELSEALRRYPRNFRFMSTLVELESQTKGVNAGLQLADALQAEPLHQPFASLLKGDALMRARRYNAALRAYMDVYASDPEVPPLMRAAAAYVATGQEAEATALLQAWLAKTPNTPGVLQELAKLDIRAGRLDQAEAHLQALLGMAPRDGTALNNLAAVYQMRGDKRARATAQQAYLQDGGPGSADTLGWILVGEGDATAAVPLLQQAAAGAPSDVQTQYHLAAALKGAGRGSEAAPILKAILASTVPFADRAAAEQLAASLPK